jgi:hypothetical protein
MAVALLGIFVGLSTACGAAGPTPTRTPRAVADSGNATQTPWFIYVPVTTTPEPFTVTPLPTVTSPAPTPKPPSTRAPRPVVIAASPTPVLPAAVIATLAPTASPTPTCGELPTIGPIKLPEQGTTRTTGPHSAATVQFIWDPSPAYDLDPDIGYLIDLTSYLTTPSSPVNRQHIYISHNIFRQMRMAILDKNATWSMTNGDTVEVRWTITVVKVTTAFNDQTYDPGPTTPCAPPVGPYTFHLVVS